MKRSRNRRFDFFLDEMLSAMDRILDYSGNLRFEDFQSNSLIRDAVIRNFEIMGEAVKHVPFGFQKKNKSLPWQQMLMLRNFIVHEFFDIDDEILWEIIQTDLTQNRNDLAVAIKNL